MSEGGTEDRSQEENRSQPSRGSHVSPSVKVFPMSSVKKIVEMEMSEFSSVNRVSSSALIALYDAILKHGRMIARRAVEYALREDRKTVSEDDIKRAIADILL